MSASFASHHLILPHWCHMRVEPQLSSVSKLHGNSVGSRVMTSQSSLHHHVQSPCCKVGVEVQLPTMPHYHCGWGQRQMLKGHVQTCLPGGCGSSQHYIDRIIGGLPAFAKHVLTLPIGIAMAGKSECHCLILLYRKRWGPLSYLVNWHHCARVLEHCFLLLWNGVAGWKISSALILTEIIESW